ncbi:MAG: hypothetical protein KKD24_04855, partial [Proteobacteria bacterium]|nr:hypothetical protein [Pseudomonadota bacterium]
IFAGTIPSRVRTMSERAARHRKDREIFAQLGNRIPEARIGDFSGHPGGKLGTAPYFSGKNRELSPFSVAGSENVQRAEGSRFPKVSLGHADRLFDISRGIRYMCPHRVLEIAPLFRP